MTRPRFAILIAWQLALVWCCLAAPATGADSFSEALTRGYEAYGRRAEDRQGTRAGEQAVQQAIGAFGSALEANPESLEARTALMRALFFRGEHVLTSRDEKLPVFEQGRDLADEGIALLTEGSGLDPRGGKDFDPLIEHLEKEPRAVGIYFFAAVHWGLWGRHRGKIAAARQGVAGKIRDYATIVLALDPDFEAGGGHRILGRLHAEAPKLPFVTSWVDRETAIRELEEAHRIAPDDALSLLYLAEALLEYDKSRRAEAISLLEKLTTKEPNPNFLVEELQAIADGRSLLARLR